MKRPEPNTHDAVTKEMNEFFLEKNSIDETLDNEDTMLTNPESSPYYPANLDPDFDLQKFLKQ